MSLLWNNNQESSSSSSPAFIINEDLPSAAASSATSPVNRDVAVSATFALDALALACAAQQQQQQAVVSTTHSTNNDRIVTRGGASSTSVSTTTTKNSTDPAAKDLLLNTNNISSNDVLCGRGGMTNHWPGNLYYRELCKQSQQIYLTSSKRDKAGVARTIVEKIRERNGRFLKKMPSGDYVDIGDGKAREKTSQALREGAPELRSELEQTKTKTSRRQSHGSSANRARVVSDDSVLVRDEEELEEEQSSPSTSNMAGSKRKLMDPDYFLSLRSVGSLTSTTSSSMSTSFAQLDVNDKPPSKLLKKKRGVVGGPRLKLFKSRVADATGV